ncbi:MAG: 5-formyltetrahydrofolate cyclo-ligase [Clostridiales bacterium]|nr:5-formyltetrahydrofolate cyclo-ligase [Clostridiales bacterium]
MSSSPADKHACRALGQAARRRVPDGDRAHLAATAATRLLALPEIAGARTVLAYAACAEEIDPASAITALRERGTAIAYPRLAGPGRLTLHLVIDDTTLVTGAFEIREPPPGAPEISPTEIDAVIVPGVAFDTACERVGHGAGYYDRLLPTLDRAFTVGYAFDEQVLDAIPAEDHDFRLDALVTPTKTLRRTIA